MLDAVVSLAVFLLLATPIVFLYYHHSQQDRARRTLAKQEIIYRAIAGAGWNDLGFLGDLGRLPISLSELVTNGNTLPSYAVNAATGVASGWRGPYLAYTPTGEDPFADGWGVFLSYNAQTGQVTSYGPDHAAGGSDDLVYPLDPIPVLGTLIVTPYVNDIPNPKDLSVTVWENSNGLQQVLAGSPYSTTQRFVTTTAGFSFNVSQGVHAVRMIHDPGGGMSVTQKFERVAVRGGAQVAQALRVTSEAPVHAVAP